MTGLYCQVSDLPLYCDSRRVLQLASDSGVAATPAVFDATPPTDGDDLTAYNRLLQLVLAACAEIDTVCQNGKRYTRADLEAIATAAVGSTDAGVRKRAAVLQQLAADLTIGNLVSIRAQSADTVRSLAPRYEAAQETLQRLYDGHKVFDVDANIDASLPKPVSIGKLKVQATDFNELFGYWPSDNFGGAPYGC